MLIKIKYQNNRFDLVKSEMLDQFLSKGKVKEFYRYSEERWVTVGTDTLRKSDAPYFGTERRSQALREMNQL